MSSEIAVSARNLTKTYRIFGHPGDRIKQAATFGLRKYHKEFTALRDVSFDIRKGETVGIIGRNGSGKSTLLQLICGILKPTSGTVQVNGSVSALLELGAGFNPEFTGRENIYFQGALMGLSKAEMGARFKDIVAFADIGDFIDQPVRIYSSGMFVRLAFAVASHVDVDILVVDEALAVGDMGFQQRCLERMRQMQKVGTTILLVSHDIMLTRNLADSMIYLDAGRIGLAGAPREVSDAYIRGSVRQEHSSGNSASASDQPALNRIGDVSVLLEGSVLRVLVSGRLATEVTRPEIVVQFRDARGYVLYGGHARGNDITLSPSDNGFTDAWAMLEVDAAPFAGEYTVSVSLNDLGTNGVSIVLDKRMDVAAFGIPQRTHAFFHGSLDLGGRWVPVPEAARRHIQEPAA